MAAHRLWPTPQCPAVELQERRCGGGDAAWRYRGAARCRHLPYLTDQYTGEVQHVHSLLDDLAAGARGIGPPGHRGYLVQPRAVHEAHGPPGHQ